MLMINLVLNRGWLSLLHNRITHTTTMTSLNTVKSSKQTKSKYKPSTNIKKKPIEKPQYTECV